ncbi:MAG: SMC-Scp complex subunit ScpB [Candidatus Micrarchaeota archaeon]
MKTSMNVESQEDSAIEPTETTALAQEPKQEAEEELLEDDRPQKKRGSVDFNLVKTIEAALFLANRLVSFEELSKVTNTNRQAARTLVEKLKDDYETKEGALEVVVADEGASLQVKPEFLQNVSELSKKPDLRRKSMKILALIAKKGQLLQSELKKYFRGEIYFYTTELKQKGYLESEKRGNTRLLKPSKKFAETFQMSQ